MLMLTKSVALQGAFFLGTFLLLFLVDEGFTCKASPFGTSQFHSPSPLDLHRKTLPPFATFSDLSDSKPQEVNISSYIIIYLNQ